MEPIILNLGHGFGLALPSTASPITTKIRRVTVEYETEDVKTTGKPVSFIESKLTYRPEI